jgi:YVTN family beta-propeller protein
VIEYRTLNVRIDALHGDRYKAIVRGPDKAEGESEFELTFDDVDFDAVAAAVSRPRSARRRVESDESAQARLLGERLFELIFQTSARKALDESLMQTHQASEGLRFVFQLDGAGPLRNVPWELLWDSPRFISTSAYTPVLRYVKTPVRPLPLSLQAPLRILGMVSSPSDMPPLDAEREQAQLVQACESLIDRGLLEIDWVSEPSLSGLLEHLNEGEYHIFHFIGHGDFDEQAQDGVLLFEARAGRSHRLTGTELGTILADQHTLRLAVINACEGARMALDSSGIAASLMQYGVPAVIAMQFEISDEAAIGFARHFYGSLARSHPLDKALTDARRGMFAAGQGLEWATPVLFTSVDDGRLFEVAWDKLEKSPTHDDDIEDLDLPIGLGSGQEDQRASGGEGRRAPEGKGQRASAGEALLIPEGEGQLVPDGDRRPLKGVKGGEDGQEQTTVNKKGKSPRRAVWAASAGLLVVVVVALLLAGVFSGGSGSAVGSPISIGESPVGLATGAGRVWVTSSNVERLSWIAPPATKIAGYIKVGRDPNSVMVEPNGYVWVVLLDENKVKAIEPRLGRVLASYPVGSKPNTLAIGLGSVWVANSGDGTVSRIDPRSGSVHTVLGVGAHPTGIAVGEGSVWVASSADRRVARISPRSDMVTQRIAVGRSTQAIVVGAGAVWVTNSHEGTVSKIDPRSHKVVKVIAVGHTPEGIAIASNGIWVANSGDGTVSQIDPASDKQVGKAIVVGGHPNAVAVAPGQIWVTNLEESTVIPIKP